MGLWEHLFGSGKRGSVIRESRQREVEIPAQFVEPLLIRAAELELPVEEIVERALQNLIEGSEGGGG